MVKDRQGVYVTLVAGMVIPRIISGKLLVWKIGITLIQAIASRLNKNRRIRSVYSVTFRVLPANQSLVDSDE
jgi:hypothetical protein